MPQNGRSDKIYCSDRCRRIANREGGRVASVRRLKSGLMSVVVHMPDAGLRPGDKIGLGKTSD